MGDRGALFYEFSLERHVPASHVLRSIERRRAATPGSVLQLDGLAFGRSRAAVAHRCMAEGLVGGMESRLEEVCECP